VITDLGFGIADFGLMKGILSILFLAYQMLQMVLKYAIRKIQHVPRIA
jgi:hypothetical protein